MTPYQQSLLKAEDIPLEDGLQFKSARNEIKRLAIFVRDSFTCVYCGGEAEHLDHVVPKACGGTNAWDNLAASCAHCNLSKHCSDLELWRGGNG